MISDIFLLWALQRDMDSGLMIRANQLLGLNWIFII